MCGEGVLGRGVPGSEVRDGVYDTLRLTHPTLNRMFLREALKVATQSGDNHLRALVMALIASQYLNTSTEHAEAMLATAEQLAAGLGAQPRPPKTPGQSQGTPQPAGKKPADGVGNAALRLWIGERVAGEFGSFFWLRGGQRLTWFRRIEAPCWG